MGVVWHGNYARYFEEGRRVLFAGIDFDYPVMNASGFIWPVVEMKAKFIRPLRYSMDVVIEARLVEYENRIRVDYELRDFAGTVLCRGQTLQIAVDAATGETQFETPDILRRRIVGAHPSD